MEAEKREKMRHAYGEKFMSYADESSRVSAERITRILHDVLEVRSVLDVGCALGTWLAAWRQRGVETLRGVDGPYVDRKKLLIRAEEFSEADLGVSLQLDEQFDLVQSLEVAEHLPERAADSFVQNLVRHSRGVVLFSAAPPGQGGEFHLNEQPYDYWRAKFSSLGYRAFDFVRPRIRSDTRVSFWYRYNTLLYVGADQIDRLPASVRAAEVPPGTAIEDLSPAWFKVRKRLVRTLPRAVQEALASAKARAMRTGRL